MELLTSIIDLDSIQPKKSQFLPEQKAAEIEALANTIVDLGGSVNIPVVKQISIENYELVFGYLDYYAYLKAREISPQLPDRMTVFVANATNQSAIQKQLDILQAVESIQNSVSKSTTDADSSEIGLRIRNIESSITNNQKVITDGIKQLKIELLQEITAQLPKPIPALEAFNRILEPEIAYKVQRKLEFLGVKTAEKAVKLLQDVSRAKQHKSFQGFSEVIDALKVPQKKGVRKLITEQKMLAAIDRWND